MRNRSRKPASLLVPTLALLLAMPAGDLPAARQAEEAQAAPADAPVPEQEQTEEARGKEKPGFWRRVFGGGAGKDDSQDETRAPAARRSTRPTRDLARLQKRIRSGPLGQDPIVMQYLDLVDRHEATVEELNDFANFLARRGFLNESLGYYEVAAKENPRDSALWVNYGTVSRRIGRNGDAEAAFRRALGIDPNDAQAHYNLGALLDETGDYDQAVKEYKIALTLDPRLGDPAYNSQAVNNEKLLVVKLELYKTQAGALDLPLQRLPGEPPASSTGER